MQIPDYVIYPLIFIWGICIINESIESWAIPTTTIILLTWAVCSCFKK